MLEPGATPAAEPTRAELEACVRDLLSLLALPSLWTGQDAERVLSILFEALEAVLPVDVLFCEERDPDGVATLRRLRIAGAEADAAACAQWRDLVTQRDSGGVTQIDTPNGRRRIAAVGMSAGSAPTRLGVGSPDERFPTRTQRAYLVAAAGLAASGLKAAQLAAQQKAADAAKDEFLAVLAHELRNPLAPLSNGLHILQRGAVLPEVHADTLALMGRQMTQLVRLVDDLLDVARITRGALQLHKAPVEVAAVVHSAVETCAPLFAARSQPLAVDVADATGVVDGDALRLAQVVANLLNNASKYTPPQGRITLVARRSGRWVDVRVRDSGAGISAQALPHVFEMFRRGDQRAGAGPDGLGVGLTLARRIVEMHGGRLEAHSEGPGRGSEFCMSLPLGDRPLPPAPGVAPAAPSPAQRVLVVDDNADAAASLGLALRLHGVEVAIAGSGREALDTFARFRPDAVLLDLGMPGMDGFAVAQALRARAEWPRATLIALTGWGQARDRERTREAGFDHHLVKPVAIDDVLALIAALGQKAAAALPAGPD